MNKKERPKNDPWDHAGEAGRDFLRMEDISAAIDCGCDGDRAFIQRIVLKSIATNTCEDPSGCAWMAINHEKEPYVY